MLIKNIKYNTFPCVAHNPFTESNYMWDELNKNQIKKCIKPDDLTIITWNNKIKKGLLEIQLDNLNIDYICLGKGAKWDTNRNKIKFLLEYIDNIKTSYILCLDCYDVIVTANISTIIEKFKHLKCNLLFNATGVAFPPDKNYKIIQKIICKEPFCFLNSGAFLGETKFIKSVYSDLDLNDPHWPISDQFLLRKSYLHLYPKIQIDWKCTIFQIMHLFENKYNIEKYVKIKNKLFL
jgi:hypothetical protein